MVVSIKQPRNSLVRGSVDGGHCEKSVVADGREVRVPKKAIDHYTFPLSNPLAAVRKTTMAEPAADNTSSAFEAKSAVGAAATVGLQAGTVGLAVSAIQNALGKHSYGAMGVLTRTGGTIGYFGAYHSPFGLPIFIIYSLFSLEFSCCWNHFRIYGNIRREPEGEGRCGQRIRWWMRCRFPAGY